jgi:hypothetical protein
MERAVELIEMRRERGPVQKKKLARKGAPSDSGPANKSAKGAKAAKAPKAPKAPSREAKASAIKVKGRSAKPAPGKKGPGGAKPKRDSAAALGVTRVIKRRAKSRK